MLTTSNVSMIQAGKDDYYARTLTQEDFWFGNGLLSPIGDSIPNPNQTTVVQLTHPDYEAIRNSLKEEFPPNSKKLAIDITFSPPKSVSIAMLNPTLKCDLIDVHNQAVKRVLAFIEENHVILRKHTNKDNKTEHIKTKNALFACLQHRVSREQYPQLHTHCLLFRKTMVNGKIMTIENRFIHSNQYLFSLMYDNELCRALQERHIPLREANSPDHKNNHFEISGVSDVLIDHFSKRKHQILNYKKTHNFSDTWEGAHAVGLASRKAKPPEDLQALEKVWQQDIKELGGFSVQKTSPTNEPLRALEIDTFIKSSIDALQEKAYAFSKSDIMIEVYKQGMMLGITLPELENTFDNHLQSHLIQVGFRHLNNEPYFTIPKNMARAKYIDNILLTPKIEDYSTLSTEIATEQIQSISKELKESQGWELSEGQKRQSNLCSLLLISMWQLRALQEQVKLQC